MSSMKTSNSCTNKPQMLADRSSLQNRRRRSVQMRAQEGEKTEVGPRNSDSRTALVLLTKTIFFTCEHYDGWQHKVDRSTQASSWKIYIEGGSMSTLKAAFEKNQRAGAGGK